MSVPSASSAPSLFRVQQLVGLRRWEQAREALAPFLSDPASDARPWCLLAQCELGMGNPAAAAKAAGRALVAEPEEEWAHRLLAIAELRQNHRRAAVRAAERAWTFGPDLPETAHTLVTTLLVHDRKTDRALDVARRALAANPDNALAHETMTLVAVRRREWSLAERHARAGLAIDPQDADLMLHLGQALQGQGRHEEAAEMFAASTRSDPTDQRGRRALGRIGLAATGGGLLGAKALIPVLVGSNAFGAFVDTRRYPLTVPLLIGLVILLVFLVGEVRHRRAVARIAPRLQGVARSERARLRSAWVLRVSVLALVVAVVEAGSGNGVSAAIMFGSAGAALVWLLLTGRLSRLVPGLDRRFGRFGQSIRLRRR